MAIAAGARLGPYAILSPLGAGGFGEVYKARDTRLDRTVAIKILPSTDPELKARFEREAKAIAALQHPHICTLFDVGHQDGTDYLVLEYLEGETLAQRLERAPLKLDEALKTAIEIADALDKAHRAGIVHRDLKPANIMLTNGGVKLLDFGLAKLRPAQAGVVAGMTAMATQQTPLTGQGSILGTLHYMAPEQLEGQQTDARTDIFAFGAVVYEMLTGRKAFEGKSQASLIGAIMRSEPTAIGSLQPLTPPVLGHIVNRCLEKKPDDRWQTATDLKSELTWIASEGFRGSHFPTGPLPTGTRQVLRTTGWMLAGLMAGVVLTTVLAHLGGTSPETIATTRFIIPPPERTTFVSGPPWGSPLAVSPDGRRVVFVAAGQDGRRRLWVRALDALTAQVIPGTDDASAPFWSPDSQWVAFFADNRLKRAAISGGEAQTLCECHSGGGGGTWSPEDVILFAPAVAGSSGLFRVPAWGGSPAQVTTLDGAHGERNHVWPVFLPDGRHFLYSVTAADRPGIFVGDLNSPNRVRLLPLEQLSTLAYTSPGYLLYARSGVLFAQPFDTKRLALAGDPMRVVEGVDEAGPGSAAFSVSSTGVLAYWSGAIPRSEQLTWVRRDGIRIATVGTPGPYFHFALAPDERQVAVTRYEPGEKTLHSAIWVIDPLRGAPTKITFESGAGMPVWSPDATRVVFASPREGPPTLYQKPTGGLGEDELLMKGGDNHPTDWSADGHTIVYEALDAKTRNDLWLLSMSGERKSLPFLRTSFNETGGRISPDGLWMAYTSDESGRNEIYVTSYPEPRGKWRISTNGGTQAEWRRDGRELFYRTPDRQLMAVPITGGAKFDAGTPQALFELPPEPPAWIQSGVDQRVFAPSADGQRFLIGVSAGEGSSTPITVVLNWQAALGARERR